MDCYVFDSLGVFEDNSNEAHIVFILYSRLYIWLIAKQIA